VVGVLENYNRRGCFEPLRQSNRRRSKIQRGDQTFRNFSHSFASVRSLGPRQHQPQSMTINSGCSPSIKNKLKPNSLIIDREKLKENFKGDSVTVVRTHTIESCNEIVSCFIQAKLSPDRKEFAFELNAFLSERIGAPDQTNLSKMKIVPVNMTEKQFFDRLCELQLGYLQLAPNHILINNHIEWLLKLLISHYLTVGIDEVSKTMLPTISTTPQPLHSKIMKNQITSYLVHDHHRRMILVYKHAPTNK
jgi:hypothetical protein